MSKTGEKVQIDKSLYSDIVSYFLHGDRSEYREKLILDGINKDFDKRIERELYTTYKTAPTPEQREAARQEYLDRKGISKDFRW